ncbi:toll/interleukin-1 receptor domain-containing protein [Raoultella planticola]|uniref:toll/interleukin-1 receptor domain-containing protein n=1 Tax=Raoultella planticola TaxID=575 RepID=UPI00255CCD79|nr:toll/interleukin-1 receptor domain-containing protein [Raoultella planticola]
MNVYGYPRFSYSHADEALRNELETHLSPLKRMGTISAWHDRRIAPGHEFEHEIDRYFAEANIILLLVSSDFIASDYCWMNRHGFNRHLRVI